MSTEVLVALISLVGVVVSAILSLSLTNWRLSQIEKKMDNIDKVLREHNQYAQKFTELSGDIKLITLEIKHIKELKEKELS